MKLLYIAALSIMPFLAHAETSTLDRLAGSFQQNGIAGMVYRGKLTYAEVSSDLKIEKIDANKAKISVVSIQNKGSSCELEGIADVIDNQLVYKSPSEDESQDCVLRFKEEKDAIRLEDVNGACRNSYCGFNAGLEIDFPLNSRKNRGLSYTTLLPKPAQSLCFSRGYATAHLQDNPKQLIGSIQLAITARSNGTDAVVVRASSASLEAEGDVTEYQGAGACSKLSASDATCYIDDDSGQFAVQNNKDGSIFLVIKTHLKLDGVAEGQATAALNLDGADKSNRLFKLYPEACPVE